MEDVYFSLYDNMGNIITVKGAYLITDAGFLQIGAFMDPRITSSVANCKLHVSTSGADRVAKLVCSVAKIDRNTEIMWSYGAGHNCISSVVDDSSV
jgi:hypothetical protein